LPVKILYKYEIKKKKKTDFQTKIKEKTVKNKKKIKEKNKQNDIQLLKLFAKIRMLHFGKSKF